MPWIHIDDIVEEMLFAAREPNLNAPLNGTAPHPVTNREFTKALGRVIGRPCSRRREP
jgi:NAD dependent epimerase/dehydratase family enzyme